MQTKTISERELVIRSMEELCRKTGFADPKDMVQRNLEFVADSIESKTGVLISLSTIKRLINGEFSRLPQIATLNAIAVFLGYANWQDYKINKTSEPQPQPIISNANNSNQPTPGGRLQTRKASYKKYLFAGALAVIAIMGLLAILKFQKPGPRNIEKSEFSARKTTSNDLPNTVVFNYNVDNVIADSFFIQQSWDRNRRVRIYKNNYTLTDIYYEPGYHKAKLIANDQVIKTVDVSIPTDRWFFSAKEKIPKAQPKYIQAGTGIHNGSLQLLPQEVLNSQVDMQKENDYAYLYFPSKIEYSSDNFVMKFRIKVNPVTNDYCPSFMVEVFCQNNFMYFTSTPKGCASEITAQFGENLQSGKTNDLSALATDSKAWQEMELTVKNKKVSITMNNKDVFSTTYRESAGLLTGLGFISNGLVEVDFVEMKTVDGKDVYRNDFE
jgi:hypothetical protein